MSSSRLRKVVLCVSFLSACNAAGVVDGGPRSDAGGPRADAGATGDGGDTRRDGGRDAGRDTDRDSGRPDAGSPGTDAGSDSRLWPIESGRIWAYALVSGTCPADEAATAVFDGVVGVGEITYDIGMACLGAPFSYRQTSNGAVYLEYGGSYLMVPEPPDADFTWEVFGFPSSMSPVPTITVPDGTYTDCWQVIAGTDTTVYCPGVGPVRAELGGGAVIELMDRNF